MISHDHFAKALERAPARPRTHTDDFYDHRKGVLDRIRHALETEKRK